MSAIQQQRGSTRGLYVVLVVCLGLGLGCQTMRSFEHGCPGVYSGVRFYKDHIKEIPLDGKLFFGADLPFSALMDTLLLPLTSFSDPEPPTGGYPPGCRWAR